MEPRREDLHKALEPGARPKPKRFRIVKLEERIAPSSKGGTANSRTCYSHYCPSNPPTICVMACY